MKVVRAETLFSCGPFSESKEWVDTRDAIQKAIEAVDWPAGSEIWPFLGFRSAGPIHVHYRKGKSLPC